MREIILLTPKQSRRVNSLIKKMCCNYDNGPCILLDDGDPCVCPQIITFSHIICKYFKRSVLPGDKELYIEVMKPKNSKKCSVCGKEYISKGNKSKYCDDCRKSITKRQAAERKRKQRLMSRNRDKKIP